MYFHRFTAVQYSTLLLLVFLFIETEAHFIVSMEKFLKLQKAAVISTTAFILLHI